MHVIFIAPHFPANQHKFVRGLKNVGARVSGIIDVPIEHCPRSVLEMLDDVEVVPAVTNIGAVEQAVRNIQRRGPWVHKLEATVEAHVLVASQVRENTGIPGLSHKVTELCRDKYKMKQFLLANGFPCAQQAAVSTGADAREAIQRLGYPVILKPRDGAGASATYKITDPASLEHAIKETGLDHRERFFTMEEFLSGHEGFFDTMTVNGRVFFEGICHYYPNVLTAMRTREVNPYIAVTNRIDAPGYEELRVFGRKVINALGISTAPTHMEWFYGPKGLKFSEIGCRPPGVSLWDIYCEANDFDLYTEWARGVCWGAMDHQPSRNYSGALLAIRPDRDGTIQGYAGVDDVQRRYGKYIFAAHLPRAGSRTQPVEAGYRANAWMHIKHPDYDAVREIAEDIGRRIQLFAR